MREFYNPAMDMQVRAQVNAMEEMAVVQAAPVKGDQKEKKKAEKEKPAQPPTSTKEEAEARLEKTALVASSLWPHVAPEAYKANLLKNVKDPASLNQGEHTNFCGYAALMTYVIEKDPAGYVDMMVALYNTGETTYDNGQEKMSLSPGRRVREAAGSSEFTHDEKDGNKEKHKGLTENVADQVLFLTLANEFRGYVNIDMRYGEDNENGPWAGTNLNKFVRMLRKFGYNVASWGSDLGGGSFIPRVQTELGQGNDVFLFVNSRAMHDRIDPESFRNSTGSHYIRIRNFRSDDGVNFEFWDYGKWKPEKKMTMEKFDLVTYGVISIRKSQPNEVKN